ncbi:MAG: Crp/Fnr family transcriptional regulator [Atopobiaceae bacterium]|nr:Crp/Fnr family transcriptional regulator [Atopobiaceae bacterium]
MATVDLAQPLSQALPFWEELSEQDKNLLAQSSTVQRFSRGEQITGKAAECLGGFIVVEGAVRSYMMSEEGREVTIARMRPSEPCLLGASCVLHSIAFDVFMEAELDSTCIIIPPQALNAVFEHDMRAENWSLNTIVDRFSDIMWSMQQILFMSFDRRLAIFLYEESSRTKSDELRMTQEQIAKHLGSAREVVSRMLSYFSDEGLVEVGRGRVVIRDRVRLRDMALGS